MQAVELTINSVRHFLMEEEFHSLKTMTFSANSRQLWVLITILTSEITLQAQFYYSFMTKA